MLWEFLTVLDLLSWGDFAAVMCRVAGAMCNFAAAMCWKINNKDHLSPAEAERWAKLGNIKEFTNSFHAQIAKSSRIRMNQNKINWIVVNFIAFMHACLTCPMP